MIKKILVLTFSVTISLCFSQQTKQLQTIKKKYDTEVDNLGKSCTKNLEKSVSEEAKRKIYDECRKALSIINSQRNTENLKELARIKSGNTDIKSEDFSVDNSDIISSVEEMADYPGGIPAFRNEVSNNFDAEAINGDGIFRCEITFVIERDGSFSEVKAAGNNEDFNRQAELAVYLTEKKFTPGKMNGVPVRSRFRMPLSLSFE